MRDFSAALALRLQNNLKLKVGESVAVCLPNIPEYPAAILGPLEAGLVVTPINPYYNAGINSVLSVQCHRFFIETLIFRGNFTSNNW